MNETIAAISTPPGEGAVGIVRLSGHEALHIADAIFRGSRSPSGMKTHTLHYKEVYDPDTDAIVDTVLLAVMRGPGTYTGEDMVEIHCHGGPVVLGEVLDLVCRHGAVPAQRGEFSKRAFLNGRMDLSQAEAVLDLIRARTKEAAQCAAARLAGRGTEVLAEVKVSIVHILALVEASIDFPEDESLLDTDLLSEEMMKTRARVEKLIENGSRGKVVREGITAAIVGKPNVGKSSLLNALLQEDRAIVTAVPGTTRDYLAEWLDLSGVPVRLIDTAGLREPNSSVEMQGVMRARKAMEASDFVLLLLDWSDDITEEDREVLKAAGDRRKLLVLNKCDLKQKMDTSSLKGWFAVSAKYGHGLEELKEGMGEMVWESGGSGKLALFTRARHLSALKKCTSHLEAGMSGIAQGKTAEIVALELRDALSALGEIAGETTADDVLDKIFAEFCIGK